MMVACCASRPACEVLMTQRRAQFCARSLRCGQPHCAAPCVAGDGGGGGRAGSVAVPVGHGLVRVFTGRRLNGLGDAAAPPGMPFLVVTVQVVGSAPANAAVQLAATTLALVNWTTSSPFRAAYTRNRANATAGELAVYSPVATATVVPRATVLAALHAVGLATVSRVGGALNVSFSVRDANRTRGAVTARPLGCVLPAPYPQLAPDACGAANVSGAAYSVARQTCVATACSGQSPAACEALPECALSATECKFVGWVPT